MASDPSRKRLPFEPGKSNDQSDRIPAKLNQSTQTSKATAEKPRQESKSRKTSRSGKSEANAIPEVVSRRMLKRMLIFSGIPTFAGVLTFFVSYFLLVREVVELPSYFVLLTTLGCFGLGVLGLSYGALSASWDESRLGHWFGFDEFRVNFGRLTGAWGAKSDS